MEQEKINVLYDENGTAVRVQMDFELYEQLLEQVPHAELQPVMAH